MPEKKLTSNMSLIKKEMQNIIDICQQYDLNNSLNVIKTINERLKNKTDYKIIKKQGE